MSSDTRSAAAPFHRRGEHCMTQPTADKPSVLYVCIHNAGRSQMAAAYTRHLSGGAVEVLSAGSEPKILTTDAVRASDVVITMGCGDTCPIFPGKRYEDWVLEDPAGKGVDSVRPIRDDIKGRVLALLAELGVAPVGV
jgi:arsenate reductase (thioredoxin)